jgi:acyl-CoA reductase-like NAD-dependent aldehyde dehydrogenase
MTLTYDKLYLGGAWQKPSSSATITVVSPSTEDVIGSVPEGLEADVDAAVSAARAAFDDPAGWSSWHPARRAEVMERLADEMDKRAGEMAQRVSSQNGMPVAVSGALEVVFPQILLRYYAGLAKGTPTDEERPGLLGGTTLVRRQPVGVVAAIVPWNFPQALAAFKYAPAFAAGCTLVVKPSPETVLDSYLFAESLEAAGVPAGVINIVPAGREVGAYLVQHPGVDKVAFTGSTAAGRSIAEVCGRLLRPVTLELGGKSATIILDDAALDLAAVGEKLFGATLLNQGQTCYLGTRILAPRSRYDEVVELFTTFASVMKLGDALDPATQIGPMSSARHRDRVEGYIAKGKSDGARVTIGGGRPAGVEHGFYVEPTVFADVDNSSTIAQEEIFGPVLSVIAYGDDAEAIAIANDSDFGLGGTVWTDDHDRGLAVAKQIKTGTIGINGYLPDPTAPFGGVKASGLGRELGPEGLAAYQVLQSVYL